MLSKCIYLLLALICLQTVCSSIDFYFHEVSWIWISLEDWLISLNCHFWLKISGRYVHRRDVSKSSSDESDESKAGLSLDAITNSSSFDVSKDLTDADITKMKNDVSKELTPFQLEEFGRILLKFKKGTTTRDRLGGMVREYLFTISQMEEFHLILFPSRLNCWYLSLQSSQMPQTSISKTYSKMMPKQQQLFQSPTTTFEVDNRLQFRMLTNETKKGSKWYESKRTSWNKDCRINWHSFFCFSINFISFFCKTRMSSRSF